MEMGEFAYCAMCGKLFIKRGTGDLCPQCQEIEDEKFSKVESYLWEHPNSSIPDVSEKTGVEKKWILRFIKKGRIVNRTTPYPCKRCGKPITHGEYCEECLAELRKESLRVKRALREKIRRDKMYIKENKKKKEKG